MQSPKAKLPRSINSPAQINMQQRNKCKQVKSRASFPSQNQPDKNKTNPIDNKRQQGYCQSIQMLTHQLSPRGLSSSSPTKTELSPILPLAAPKAQKRALFKVGLKGIWWEREWGKLKKRRAEAGRKRGWWNPIHACFSLWWAYTFFYHVEKAMRWCFLFFSKNKNFFSCF